MVSTTSREIPHSLDLVIDFVNTVDPDFEHPAEADAPADAIATPEALGSWLVQRGLLRAQDLPLRERDREATVRLREALRSLMLANNGAEPDPGAARELDAVARRGELGVALGPDGAPGLQAHADGLAGALAALVVPVTEGGRDGSWRRVKACRADDCQWAFYDRSRNRSGVWCEMAVCGNREKVRAYRNRSQLHRHA
jgi:predicted RNA-binding Zn ribbon-like protein